MPSEEVADRASSLATQLMSVLEGQDLPLGLAALLWCVRDVGAQAESAEVRAAAARDLRMVADELEAIDAPKH